MSIKAKTDLIKEIFSCACLTLLISSCAFNRTDGPIISVPPASVSAEDQEHAALAFIAYTGELLKGSDTKVEQVLAPCMQKELDRQPFTRGKYKLIWGPAVYKFELAELDDNMMYVVQNTQNPSDIVISIRGTNGTAILDWLVEDFEVAHKIKWPYQSSEQDLSPKISEGTDKGLKILQSITPAVGTPGTSKTIDDFLKQIVASGNIEKITVTGHSLGGALSPTFALWLNDTRSQWDSGKSIQLSVVALAGPTPGDKDFSIYYDKKLGAYTKRFHNPYDVVPLAWEVQSMETIPNLYKPSGIKAPIAVEEALLLGIELVKHKEYTQIVPNTPTLSGKVYKPDSSFLKQVAWQHSCGYYCNMQLLPKFKPISLDCKNFDPPASCTSCP